MGFLDDYEPVADRITKFWGKHSNGRIHTEIVLINETEIVIKASVWTDREDARAAAIDFAQETRGSNNINKASFVENCSASAIGRALATLGFSTKKRASREEMLKVHDANRDFLEEAAIAAGNGDIETLRAIYNSAIKAAASRETLSTIKQFADDLKNDGDQTK